MKGKMPNEFTILLLLVQNGCWICDCKIKFKRSRVLGFPDTGPPMWVPKTVIACGLLDFQKASVRSISGLGPPDPLAIPLVCELGGAGQILGNFQCSRPS